MATAWRRVITRRRAGEGASGVCCIRSSPSRPPPRLRGLRRRGLLPLVVEDDAARFQRLRFGELEFQLLRAFLEQGISAAEDDWSHAKAVFVDQASPCQRCGEIGAAEDEQVLAELPFQLGDLLLCVTFHEPRIVPLGLFHRPREDDLGDTVHEIGDFAFLLRPKRRHALVAHTTAAQHADRLSMFGGEPLQLLAPTESCQSMSQLFRPSKKPSRVTRFHMTSLLRRVTRPPSASAFPFLPLLLGRVRRRSGVWSSLTACASGTRDG